MVSNSTTILVYSQLTDADRQRQSGFSGMLAAFPPPGLASRGGTPRPGSAWPAPFSSSPTPDRDVKKPRRCCGLPIWGFLLILLALLVIIAAAIVVPLEFLVIHKPTSSSAVQACQSDPSTACQNGGSSTF